ncbi:hypothetical protein AaE_005162 [Aphanomyces astaci]|uniref:Uncharacterized protein n=1 Tax=Aphanomyces astaci TaxID=112090 RepID=A0A6A5A8M4_APHAT|nr:hypothetical protein AaE_005162 [Aphanomyces astaci]
MCVAITFQGNQCKNQCSTRYCHRHFHLYENEIVPNDDRIAKLEVELKKALDEKAKIDEFNKLCKKLSINSIVMDEAAYFKNSFVSLQKLNKTRIDNAKVAIEGNEALKETIAKLESKIKLLNETPTSPKSQARVTNVSFVKLPTNQIKTLEQQVV